MGCKDASRVTGVACGGDGDCTLGTVTGTCEATGYCSYPDAGCIGGRYAPGAGAGLSNTCVGGPAACGVKDAPCCAEDLCGSDLVCLPATTTCACGDRDQPCCDGTTCGANLACTGGSCTCGAIGDPCCGGSTCNTGLSCSSGACTGGIVQVAVGRGHTCALRTDGTVSCWGHDWKPYAFGTPGMGNAVIASTTATTVPGLDTVDEIRAGEMHTCARKADRTLWCWGHNERGQLGDGTTTSSAVAVQVMGLTSVGLFDGGRMHTCAVGTVGTTTGLWCWGRGGLRGRGSNPVDQTVGRLGTGDIVDASVPARVDLSVAAGAGQTVKALSAGGYHTCIAMSDNRVWCWGRGGSGELGNAATASSKVPVAVNLAGITIPAGVTIDEISCTDTNSAGSACLRLSNGAVHCWGSGREGEMGDGVLTTTNRTAPAAGVITTALAGATFVELASAGQAHCGRASNGTVWCWGRNKSGLLGINVGDETNEFTPVQATALSGATRLDMSHRNACVVDGMSQLFCWGNNRRSQATASSPAPVQINEPTQVSP
jgi:alpha-tubulin suppressor-like RCC1 family protein